MRSKEKHPRYWTLREGMSSAIRNLADRFVRVKKDGWITILLKFLRRKRTVDILDDKSFVL